MKLDTFVMTVVGSWKEIVGDPYFEHDKGFVRVPLSFLHRLNNLTMGVDYRCGFKEDGSCKNIRRFGMRDSNTKCCCGGCKGSIGYLSQIPRHELHIYAEQFDEETGFWRPNTGCILPRHMRSPTCLRYHCNDYDENGGLKRLPIRSQVIIELVSHPGITYKDNLSWYNTEGRKIIGSDVIESYVDAWVERVGDKQPVFLFGYCYEDFKAETWREYYERRDKIPEQQAVSCGG